MTGYVTDTHGLLWYFARPAKLGPMAAAAFAQVATGEADLVVPVNVSVVDLSLARTLDLRTLTVIPEMHDRLIAAEAVARGLPLITRDQIMASSRLVQTVW